MIQKIFLLAKNEIKVEQDNTVRCNFSMMVSQDVAEFEGIAQKQNRNFVTDIPESRFMPILSLKICAKSWIIF